MPCRCADPAFTCISSLRRKIFPSHVIHGHIKTKLPLGITSTDQRNRIYGHFEPPISAYGQISIFEFSLMATPYLGQMLWTLKTSCYLSVVLYYFWPVSCKNLCAQILLCNLHCIPVSACWCLPFLFCNPILASPSPRSVSHIVVVYHRYVVTLSGKN